MLVSRNACGIAALVGFVLVAGCERKGATPAPSTIAAEHDEVVAAATAQQEPKPAHYSTTDGTTGFVLDRSGTQWHAKLDGSDRIITVRLRDEPRRGKKEYASDDMTVWLTVDNETGALVLFQGPKQHEGVPVVRDGDGSSLN